MKYLSLFPHLLPYKSVHIYTHPPLSDVSIQGKFFLLSFEPLLPHLPCFINSHLYLYSLSLSHYTYK